jgi:hypothetical protein
LLEIAVCNLYYLSHATSCKLVLLMGHAKTL